MNTVENRALPSDEQFRNQCSEAGVRPDKPLFGLLTEMRDIVEIASDAVRGGARGLTTDGEAELIRRINETVQASSERHRLRLDRRASWIAGGVVVTSFLFGALGGYWYGWSGGRQSAQLVQGEVAAAFQSGGPDAASTWLRLMRHNDPRQALKRCSGNSAWVSAGRQACLVPLWLDGPSIPEISKQ
ncbi:hypothetical protein GGE65_007272 [Skermanella aerolata]|uniref:hypothetical protein n=1 Tax=Skermanella aerolata TaxID=393310 RepID=UPI003D24067E